ncbi:hypothetical protein [Lysinibacillus antri]|nr:hypothetical protein [Lysinibacillus antri]
MGLTTFLTLAVYAISMPMFYKKGYRTGITHGLDKILKELDE